MVKINEDIIPIFKPQNDYENKNIYRSITTRYNILVRKGGACGLSI